MTAGSLSGGTFDLQPTLAGRARAVGLAVLYLVAFALLLAAFVFGLAWAGFAPLVRAGQLPPQQSFMREWADAAAAVLAVVALASLTREPMARFGFATRWAGRDFLTGVVASLAMMAALFGVLAALGAYQFKGLALAPDRILPTAVFYALFSIGVGVFEETLFRSFFLVALSRAFSFWPAAVITGVLFGLAHVGNPAEAPLGLAVAGLGGVVFAYAFRRTGAIWFAIGFHTALAYTEDFVFGVPDSGNRVAQGALLHPIVRGPDWLTGGSVGPEGSVLALVMIVALALIVRFLLPRRAAPL